MPTYDYRCNACHYTFDELQSFSEPPLTQCPKCKKHKLERLFGGGGAIIFKGSGFYETDYRRAGQACRQETEAASGDKAPTTCGACGEPAAAAQGESTASCAAKNKRK
ncbi:MAG: zinc ribbon domain-containing protein [Gemmataceae bacterium]|nr:zinc ribbon domain-containing protein [Gemmata sp.]MDW8196276.1 zinc ribbon domain-containing protein [Gemmataceae bacterium]